MTVLDLAQNRIAGLKKKTAKEWAGPCPACGGTDRFVVWTDRDAWYCRGCAKGGDAIEFLRMTEGLSCPDAHEALGLPCSAACCPAREKCRLGDGKPGAAPRDPMLSTPAIKQPPRQDWQPSAATQPADAWAQKAEKLTEWAHQQLLGNEIQLDYLAARGLPAAAVRRFRLGYVPADLYRERAAWGLPAETSDRTGKPKKLWIPQGLLIPFMADGIIHRIRIRRHKADGTQPRYYWLPGSGNDVVIINPSARAFVVVESDLDALAVVHATGDLIGGVPLGTCSARPKTHADEVLGRALCILVALDVDQAGTKNWPWWRDHYARADRWPVPAGKDPGDYVKDHGGDLRAWVEAGLRKLCPAFALPTPGPASNHVEKPEPPAENFPHHHKGISAGGYPFVIAHHADHVDALVQMYPDIPVFSPAEIKALEGMTKQEAEKVLRAKQIFGPGTQVLGTKPIPKI
ncbi:CHC2 zinc finger domain-containing protein [Syntrophotalea acetylenica]|uniref:DNA primase/helicase Gp4 N-terminal Bacteriophage T7-like domain-containing protein n=1 Tax=Syntrophotalea acetylenica TaxID=29542 RepID=A0A1L3GDQ2_SYNAC|nr:CHC2 zinc finger domain-containing protein [Syntrophotalea acetylenica]APG24080.1 hypothetical protein A7E75_02830 [Syntrophotalea acetylenica]APG44662.1 hypothetical protein A6070_11455 [Syntrophotalea acetylenica]